MTGTRLRATALVGMALGLVPPHLGAASADPTPASFSSRSGSGIAQGAPRDTTLDDFLDTLADSTDRYFGVTAAGLDTTGLDSALVYGLAHPRRVVRNRLRPRIGPSLAFNRVDGPVWGAKAALGDARYMGELHGVAGYAAGPNFWLGGGGYRKDLRRGDNVWSLDVRGGRTTETLDRDHPSLRLAAARAFLAGKDRKHYLRRDGFGVRFEREAETWRASVGYRDALESPRVTTATWNLLKQEPSIVENLAATRGRAREIEYHVTWQIPRLPVTLEGTHQTASDAIRSEFEYRRYRTAVGANFGIGRVAALVPQATYGRVTLSSIPQQSFYLGGAHTLRSLEGGSRGGTGTAVAKLDLYGTRDILATLKIPHPAAFPLQVGAFAAIGAVWGDDPFGGPTVAGVDWPRRESWLSEVGVSLLYQPGIPETDGMLRLDYTEPLGPKRESTHITLSYSRAFDLFHPVRK